MKELINQKPEPNKELFFSNELLVNFGCLNCIWQELNQCPHKLEDGEIYKSEDMEGYCEKVANFFLALAEKDDSISAVKEKYHLFIQEIQSVQDYKEFHRIKKEYEMRKADGADQEVLNGYEGRLNMYKIFWANLSDKVVKGLGRIADRESKVKVESKPTLSIQNFNVLMDDARKELLEEKEE